MKLIYLINIEGTDFYKIGITKGDPSIRLKNLQVGCPFPLCLVHTFETKFGNKLEGILHRTYQLNKTSHLSENMHGFKLVGEWFELDKEDVLNFLKKCGGIEERLLFLKNNSTLEKF